MKEGKVTGVSDDVVKLRYPGEDFDNEIAKKNIGKIEFSSGRVETYNAPQNSPAGSPKPQISVGGGPETRNKIAVLPFGFVSNDPGLAEGSMRTIIQNSAANTVRKEYGQLSLQDPMTTNSILSKNNVSQENIDGLSPGEIAQMLGVEFVVFGTVKIVNKGTTSYGSAVGSFDEKEKSTSEGNSETKITTGISLSSGSTTTTINYDTTVDFKLFNDRGDNLYSESRHALANTVDAYKGSIDYMIRRTPFGSKYGRK